MIAKLKRQSPMTEQSGFLLVYKPAGITSHDVVDRIRRITGIKKVGHAGTLDPFATGLLIIGIGRNATRELSHLLGLSKQYEATFLLGAKSDTDDVTGTIEHTPVHPDAFPEEKTIRETMGLFTGIIEQIPPDYAAIKIGGKKFYELARAGKTIPKKPRTLHIYEYELLAYKQPKIVVHIYCSSGTYIRALARDLGEQLEIGAYVETLKRLSIGPFSLKEAKTLEEIAQEKWSDHLFPIETVMKKISSFSPPF